MLKGGIEIVLHPGGLGDAIYQLYFTAIEDYILYSEVNTKRGLMKKSRKYVNQNKIEKYWCYRGVYKDLGLKKSGRLGYTSGLIETNTVYITTG